MISNDLKKIYTDIHRKTDFGKRSKIPKYLKKFIERNNPVSILDFGCGKGNMVKILQHTFPKIKMYGYDPANPDFDIEIPTIDMVASTDVLEHVEPESIDDTLKMLASKARLHYHLISCAPAKLILADGRNAHLIQETPDWWHAKFEKHGYKILSEDYKESTKFSKQLRREWPVKEYFIMAELNGPT